MSYTVFRILASIETIAFIVGVSLFIAGIIMIFNDEAREAVDIIISSLILTISSIYIICYPYFRNQAKSVIQSNYTNAIEYRYFNAFNIGFFTQNGIDYEFRIVKDINDNLVVKITEYNSDDEAHLYNLKTGEEIQ